MKRRTALLLAETATLDDTADYLLGAGWHVVRCVRRPGVAAPALEPGPGAAAIRAMRPPGHRPTAHDTRPDEVTADWSDPAELARWTRLALPGPAQLLVTWVLEPTYRPVVRALGALLAPDAVVVQVSQDAGDSPMLVERATEQVRLDTAVPHRDAPDSAGLVAAVRRAVAVAAMSDPD